MTEALKSFQDLKTLRPHDRPKSSRPYSPSARAAAASTCGTRNGFVRYPATPRFTASMALVSLDGAWLTANPALSKYKLAEVTGIGRDRLEQALRW